ncbi:hypothetical protein MA16_Dca002049 [Dendrobium catenatum]|uniref:Uncharacterized protein n=1 Tax=Dendrobium catenatum TaxID=906689 RepID=A0A2I0XE75_9ASPA|nr:hypothetical protein MA16_Dca002049 [Dendrobium catenatum]
MLLENEEGYADCFVSVAVDQGGIEAVCPSLGNKDGIPILNSFVEIPVIQVDTQLMTDCVGKSAGKEIRNQNNWLIDSSEEEVYFESYDSDNDFTLDRSSIATRGKFWGRGRRRLVEDDLACFFVVRHAIIRWNFLV